MKTTKNFSKYICEAFFAIIFCLSCFTMNSDNLSGLWGYNGTVFILEKLLAIFILVFIAGIMNRKNIRFVAEFESKSVIIITLLLIFDYYVTNFSGSMFLFRALWITAIFVAQFALLLSMSIVKTDSYSYFYNKFWIGFTPLYLFTLIICFFRAPFQNMRTVNIIPFKGTFLMLWAFIKDVNISFEAPLNFFGNMLIFIPMPFILFCLLKKTKSSHIALIGIIIPIIIELYQYIFSCGDADIDDIILNWFGFFAGFALQRIINKKLLKNKT